MGEDGFLGGGMCVGYIEGVEENGVGGCVKDYGVKNEEDWGNDIDVEVSDGGLYEIYVGGLKGGIEEGK